MKNCCVFVMLALFSAVTALAQEQGYFIGFTDKLDTPYAIENPQAFLSQRSIDRRARQAISLTEDDLPVSPAYVDSLKKLGIRVKHTTKWHNGAIVFSGDKALMDTLHKYSFIRQVELTKPVKTSSQPYKFEKSIQIKSKAASENYGYGEAWDQIRTVQGHHLHNAGYSGRGMHIAVLDAGFYHADRLPAFKHLWDNNRILGTKDFVNPSSNIFTQDSHGMKVLSIMGGQMDGTYKGTAPGASYWLLRTEDVPTETTIEPDYWVCAAEFADSVGADIINSSLGYYMFDEGLLSYTYGDMDGSSRVSSAATMAAQRGMIVVVSAGNEGSNSWKYIGAPADAQQILAIGATTVGGVRANFSSFGPSYDQRVKPEVSAMGQAVAVQSNSGGVEKGNGTSYSAPVIAGLMACLWQAMPDVSAAKMRELVIRHSHLFDQPNDELGYGIPDFLKAANEQVSVQKVITGKWQANPNPFITGISLKTEQTIQGPVTLKMYDMSGQLVLSRQIETNKVVVDDLAALPKGMYVLSVHYNNTKQHIKLIKQ